MTALMACLVTAHRKRNEEDLYKATVIDLLTDLCKIGMRDPNGYKRPGWYEMVSDIRGETIGTVNRQDERTAEEIIQSIYERL